MKISVSALVILVLFCSTARVKAAGGPRLACDEPEYRFGQVKNTKNVNHLFTLRNEGDDVLEISRVRYGCGCITARVADTRIRPGGQTKLRVRFSLKGREGPQRQQIIVESNDPLRPRFEFAMVGEALAAMSVRPDRIFWGNIHEDAESSQVVELDFRLETPVRIVKSDIPSTMFSIDASVISEGESYKLRVSTVPPMPRGPFEAPLHILTDNRSAGEIIVPMTGRVVGDIFSVPAEIVLDAAQKEPATFFLVMRSGLDRRFKVLQVEPPSSEIRAVTRPMGTDRSLIYLHNMTARPELDGTAVRIVTDCERMGEIAVPVRIKSR